MLHLTNKLMVGHNWKLKLKHDPSAIVVILWPPPIALANIQPSQETFNLMYWPSAYAYKEHSLSFNHHIIHCLL